MSFCKIIATAFNPRRRVSEREVWPGHPQDVSTPRKYLAMLDYIWSKERSVDPGVDTDTVVVTGGDPDGVAVEWRELDGQRTRRGKLTVVHNPDDGGSFAAYDFAYQTLKGDYEWFLFSEDDTLFTRDGYYRKLLDCYEKTSDCGFAAAIAVAPNPAYHAHGGVGVTHRDVLAKVCLANGGHLPHPKPPYERERNISEGEVPFTNEIHKLGLTLACANDNPRGFDPLLAYPYHFLKA